MEHRLARHASHDVFAGHQAGRLHGLLEIAPVGDAYAGERLAGRGDHTSVGIADKNVVHRRPLTGQSVEDRVQGRGVQGLGLGHGHEITQQARQVVGDGFLQDSRLVGDAKELVPAVVHGVLADIEVEAGDDADQRQKGQKTDADDLRPDATEKRNPLHLGNNFQKNTQQRGFPAEVNHRRTPPHISLQSESIWKQYLVITFRPTGEGRKWSTRSFYPRRPSTIEVMGRPWRDTQKIWRLQDRRRKFPLLRLLARLSGRKAWPCPLRSPVFHDNENHYLDFRICPQS